MSIIYKMWVFFIGKLFWIIIVYLLSKIELYLQGNELSVSERILGWFFLEYLSEYYNETIENCFLTKFELRFLLSNFFIVFRNLFLYSYFFISIKLVTTLFFIVMFLIYFGFYSYKKKDTWMLNYLMFTYYCFFIIHISLFILEFVNLHILISLSSFLILFLFLRKILFNPQAFTHKVKYLGIKFLIYFIFVGLGLIGFNLFFSINSMTNNL